MAYPNISAPYGFIPINLVGGQPFAGSTRQLPLGYGYPQNIFNGDFVKLANLGSAGGAGLLQRVAISNGVANNQITGVFLGCSYTSPTTRQKLFSQWWPAGTQAGDGMAYVCDDPSTIFKAVVCSATTVPASANWGSIGSNMAAVDNPSIPASLATGNSQNAVLANSNGTAILPLRVIGLVEETAVPVVAQGSSATTTITLLGAGLPRAIPIGTDVSYLAGNGQLIRTGSFVAASAAAGATAVTVNIAPAANGVATPIPANSTILFTIYPEVRVKINAGIHAYTSGTAI